jgi:hypothetical protein
MQRSDLRELSYSAYPVPTCPHATSPRAQLVTASCCAPAPDHPRDGEWVAVEVQKPEDRKQVEWDLGVMKAVMWMCERWVFDLPVYFMVSACDEAADDRLPAAPQPDGPSYYAGLLKGSVKQVMQIMMDL